SQEIIGFRYLISMAVADMLCMVQYAFVNGFAILRKSRLVSAEARPWVQFYIDYIWFVCCFHQPLIAWSRSLAVFSPLSFRMQSRRTSYSLCILVGWIAPLILECATHFLPFHTTFYFEPALYGLANDDFEKYISGGHSQLYLVVHSIAALLPFVFYGIACFILLKLQKTVGSTKNTLMAVEIKLVLPCVLSSVIFFIGQLLFYHGTGSGKWASWLVCLIFFSNSALSPVLIIIFSDFVRNGVGHFGISSLVMHRSEPITV
ncbi:hypothetical protein PMAYCL1PPCAC_22844, partial [Pristionchus mayeri]